MLLDLACHSARFSPSSDHCAMDARITIRIPLFHSVWHSRSQARWHQRNVGPCQPSLFERPGSVGSNEPSVGSVGDSYDNALAEPINGSTRPRSSIGADPGGASKRLNSPPWNGSTGSTIDDSGAHRKHPASRGRGAVLRHAGRTNHVCVI